MTRILACCCLLLLPQTLFGQGTMPGQRRISQKATVSQVVQGATISVEYFRPVADGRTLFGEVVHWGEIWTPGANWSTSLETDRDILLNGLRVPKGKYSVWLVTSRDSAWTFFLHRDPRIWHTRRPTGTADDVVRFRVQPETLPHMEALAWYFPTVEREATMLRMHWGTTAVTVRIAVPAAPPS